MLQEGSHGAVVSILVLPTCTRQGCLHLWLAGSSYFVSFFDIPYTRKTRVGGHGMRREEEEGGVVISLDIGEAERCHDDGIAFHSKS